MPKTNIRLRPPGQEIAFSEAHNFRELGGYPTKDGRRVRYGMFYRSGALANVLKTPDDWEKFRALGIRTVLDLRATTERLRKPDPPLPGVQVFACNGMWNEDGTEMDFDPDDLEKHDELIRSLAAGNDDFDVTYARMAYNNPAYRQMFRFICQGDTPLLLHCSAGKDRTGVGALLILLMLGADRDTAVEDYLLTNRWRAERIRKSMEKYAAYLDQTPLSRQMFLSLEGVIEYNINFTLRAIEERYDSYEAYFAGEFGIDAGQLARLRDRYLE